MGMFKGNFGQVLNKWTYGVVNSFVGNIVGHALNIGGSALPVTDMDGMLAIGGVTDGGKAFTIGHYSFGPDGYEATWKDHLFVHEYGHYIQSQRYGWRYLFGVALPSLLSAWKTSTCAGMDHKDRWFEVKASKWGPKHFYDNYGSGDPNIKSADYFDIEAFFGINGIYTYYKNPRLSDEYSKSFMENDKEVTKYMQDKVFPSHYHGLTFWDFLF